MRYSTDAALSEVRARGARLRMRHHRRVTTALSSVSALLAVALFSCLYLLQPCSASAVRQTSFGAFLLSGEAGGYVLVGVIAFALGVALVIFVLRRREAISHEKSGSGRR